MFVSFVVGGRAVADTPAYEMYCPGTPVGDIVLNGAVTTGSLSPSSPTKGHSLSIADYQTTVDLPTQFVQAMAALGTTTATGYIQLTVNVADAKPAKRTIKETYSSPIPSTITSPLPVAAPSSAIVVGPFKATGTAIVVTVSTQVTMTLVVAAGEAPLKLDCLTYPNNSLSSGITTKKPKGSPVAPVLARSG